MKILAVDTGTNCCNVAVLNGKALLAEISVETGETHSKHLLRLIETALDISGIAVRQIDGFAATTGPGSFTGLRIGISAILGLASASGKPAAGMPSLEVLAWQASFSSCLIIPFIDARRGEVYCCRCRFKGGALAKEQDDAAMTPEQALCDIAEPCLFIGDGVLPHRDIIMKTAGDFAVFPLSCHNTIRASTVARLALEKFKSGGLSKLEPLIPRYVRKPDAEVMARSKITSRAL